MTFKQLFKTMFYKQNKTVFVQGKKMLYLTGPGLSMKTDLHGLF